MKIEWEGLTGFSVRETGSDVSQGARFAGDPPRNYRAYVEYDETGYHYKSRKYKWSSWCAPGPIRHFKTEAAAKRKAESDAICAGRSLTA
jgi:hypothetical protein